MYSIGEMSKISGLSVKTIRFYQEKNLLVPTYVDEKTGYRYYNDADVERATVIRQLRDLEFPLAEIAEMLSAGQDEDIIAFLQRRKDTIHRQIAGQKNIVRSINSIISNLEEARSYMSNTTTEIHEKQLEPVLVAAVRMKGKYSECGKAFSKISKHYWRYMNGKAMALMYDSEYKEEGADFEPCMPIRSNEKSVDGIDVRELPGGRAVCLMHHGSYDDLKHSSAKIFNYINKNKLQIAMPTREVYIKGPGMIFRGNPKKYVTEIQFLVENAT